MTLSHKQKKHKIRYVDGYALRNKIPDLDIILWHGKIDGQCDFVPKGELWIDKRFRKETDFLLKIYRIERKIRPASRSYKPTREELKKKLLRPGPAPNFVLRRETVEMNEEKLIVEYVRGNVVRQYLDPAFISGGHDLIYNYIPEDKIWVDILHEPREHKYILAHELCERQLMSKNVHYNDAHEQATEVERHLRPKTFPKILDIPLKIEPFLQSPGLCGPASLKMALSYFGKNYSEKYLTKLSRATSHSGTLHRGLLRAALFLGADVFEKAGGTIDDLWYFVHIERLPVIVGWYSPNRPEKPMPDEDHFSVVCRVDNKFVYLYDPEVRGVNKLPHGKFLRQWWDTDDQPLNVVDRWFMVMNFDGRKFDLPNGNNH